MNAFVLSFCSFCSSYVHRKNIARSFPSTDPSLRSRVPISYGTLDRVGASAQDERAILRQWLKRNGWLRYKQQLAGGEAVLKLAVGLRRVLQRKLAVDVQLELT